MNDTVARSAIHAYLRSLGVDEPERVTEFTISFNPSGMHVETVSVPKVDGRSRVDVSGTSTRVRDQATIKIIDDQRPTRPSGVRRRSR